MFLSFLFRLYSIPDSSESWEWLGKNLGKDSMSTGAKKIYGLLYTEPRKTDVLSVEYKQVSLNWQVWLIYEVEYSFLFLFITNLSFKWRSYPASLRKVGYSTQMPTRAWNHVQRDIWGLPLPVKAGKLRDDWNTVGAT